MYYRLPFPLHWQAFERMTRDSQSATLGIHLQLWGGSGENQDGLDIYGQDEDGKFIGIQCKLRTDGKFSFKEFEPVVARADKSDRRVDVLYIAITRCRTSRLQGEVAELTEQRIAQGKCRVIPLFWDDIEEGIIRSPRLLADHYPQFTRLRADLLERLRYGFALDLGYHSCVLDREVCVFTSWVRRNPELATGFLHECLWRLDRAVRGLVGSKPEMILASIEELRRLCSNRITLTGRKIEDARRLARIILERIQEAGEHLGLGNRLHWNAGCHLGSLVRHAYDTDHCLAERGKAIRLARDFLPEWEPKHMEQVVRCLDQHLIDHTEHEVSLWANGFYKAWKAVLAPILASGSELEDLGLAPNCSLLDVGGPSYPSKATQPLPFIERRLPTS